MIEGKTEREWLTEMATCTLWDSNRDAILWALAEIDRLNAENARLSKPRPHVVEPAIDHFGHVRCVSCGYDYPSHLPSCFRHEYLKREGKVK